MTSCLYDKELKISDYCDICITFNDFLNEILFYIQTLNYEKISKVKDFDLDTWQNICYHSTISWYNSIENISHKRDISDGIDVENFKNLLYFIPESKEERESIIKKYYQHIFVELTRQPWFQEFHKNISDII
jgi:hypothetical protein